MMDRDNEKTEYSGLGKEWLKPILDLERSANNNPKSGTKSLPTVDDFSNRCDRTIDMFEFMNSKRE